MGQARSFLTLGGSFFGNQRIALSVGLCGIGPTLAGNVGTGGAFALSREGDQDVDVPMLAPDLSRCRLGVLSGGVGEFKEGQAPRLAGSASGGKSGEGGLSTEPFTGS